MRRSSNERSCDGAPQNGLSRRRFLGAAAAGGTAAAVAATGIGTLVGGEPAGAAEIGPSTGSTRQTEATQLRNDAAAYQASIPLPSHPDNGDEALYPNRTASYTKALQHNADGTVVGTEYDKLKTALTSGNPAQFEALNLPGRGLANPLAAYAFALEGSDSHAFSIPAAPTVAGDVIQFEMAELYWMALARDLSFDLYSNDGSGIISAAISDLNGFANLVNPSSPSLSPQSIFRDNLPDNLTGNFVSQYLLQDVPYGPQVIKQKNRRRPANSDFMTNFADFLAVQRGDVLTAPEPEAADHYIRNGRDLAEWVHSDFPAQAPLNAARIIAAQGRTPGKFGDAKFSPGINDSSNPYQTYTKQIGFVTFGNQMFMDLTTRAAQLALQAAWYQKWLVHRRLRPEEYGGRIDNARRGVSGYAIGTQSNASLSDSQRLGRVFAKWGSYLLPSAFPEGSPTHPAYPSGHSTYVGAAVTMIKAFVNGTKLVANPVRVGDPNNGDNLTSSSTDLTINGELDKLVMNIGVGRLFAGVHWRGDHAYGVRLGELVAIRVLQDLLRTLRDNATPKFDLRRFDGTTVTITKSQIINSTGSALPLSNAIPTIPVP